MMTSRAVAIRWGTRRQYFWRRFRLANFLQISYSWIWGGKRRERNGKEKRSDALEKRDERGWTGQETLIFGCFKAPFAYVQLQKFCYNEKDVDVKTFSFIRADDGNQTATSISALVFRHIVSLSNVNYGRTFPLKTTQENNWRILGDFCT